MKVAYKLLSRDEATFEELPPSEQKLWTSFKTDHINHLLTGEPDTVPEFRFNWYNITGGEATAEFIPAQSSTVQAKLTLATKVTFARPATLKTIPAPKIKIPKASTSAAPPASSSSSFSPASTVPSSPTPSMLGTIPKPPAPTQTSGSSTTSSRSATLPAPSQPVSTCQLRPHKHIHY